MKCPNCQSYGLSKDCSCGSKRINPKPLKYSPEDKYGEIRRKIFYQNELENNK
ncbi:MAG: nucleolar RNA-binding Nop10p family protein [Candidatus Woesearchaeota archaeon]